jgi:hypothetical protein
MEEGIVMGDITTRDDNIDSDNDVVRDHTEDFSEINELEPIGPPTTTNDQLGFSAILLKSMGKPGVETNVMTNEELTGNYVSTYGDFTRVWYNNITSRVYLTLGQDLQPQTRHIGEGAIHFASRFVGTGFIEKLQGVPTPGITTTTMTNTAVSLIKQSDTGMLSTLRTTLTPIVGSTYVDLVLDLASELDYSESTSTCEIITRLMLMAATSAETGRMSGFVSNFEPHLVYDNITAVGDNFPMSKYPINEGPIPDNDIICRVVTFGEFVDCISGKNPFEPAWSPKHWDTSAEGAVAVIPIDNVNGTDHYGFGSFILGHMEYPHAKYRHDVVWRNNIFQRVGEGGTRATNGMIIPGPIGRILFVQVANKDRTRFEINIMSGGNVLDDQTNTPVLGAGGVDFNLGDLLTPVIQGDVNDRLQGVSRAMSYWRQWYGARDDYQSAMWVVANAITLYRPMPDKSGTGGNSADWSVWEVEGLLPGQNPFDPSGQWMIDQTNEIFDLMIDTQTTAMGQLLGLEVDAQVRHTFSVAEICHSATVLRMSIAAKVMNYVSKLKSYELSTSYDLIVRLQNMNHTMAAVMDDTAQSGSLSEQNAMVGGYVGNVNANDDVFYDVWDTVQGYIWNTVNRPQFTFIPDRRTETEIGLLPSTPFWQNGNYRPLCRMTTLVKDQLLGDASWPSEVYSDLSTFKGFTLTLLGQQPHVMIGTKQLNARTMIEDPNRKKRIQELLNVARILAGTQQVFITDFYYVEETGAAIRPYTFSIGLPDEGVMWGRRQILFFGNTFFGDLMGISINHLPILVDVVKLGRMITLAVRRENQSFFGKNEGHLKQLLTDDLHLPIGANYDDGSRFKRSGFKSLLGGRRN